VCVLLNPSINFTPHLWLEETIFNTIKIFVIPIQSTAGEARKREKIVCLRETGDHNATNLLIVFGTGSYNTRKFLTTLYVLLATAL